MKPNYTDIIIVLDRSGSMTSVASDTIGGFNTFLTAQKAVPGTATLTLNQFDDQYERIFDAQDIQTIPELTNDTFVPRGTTALLDAIGRSIKDAGRRLDAMDAKDRPSKVIFVIITDGFENASREFSAKQIDAMITHQRSIYAWEFVFLGANQDAIATAATLGVMATHAMSYAGNKQGVQSAFNSISDNTAMFRSGSKANMSYEPKDYDEQKKAGVGQ